MEIQDTIKLRGSIEMNLMDLEGNLVEKIIQHNVVVTAGRSWVLQQICSSAIVTSQSITQMAVGTGTSNAPATSDTTLQSETTRVGIGTFSTANLTANPPSWQAQASFATNQANTTLGEVALFNSSSGGTMLARATFSTVNKTTSNTLSISYTISN
jgi:hypothetical protein